MSKDSLAGALETSRLSGIPIYIYRVGDAEEKVGTAEVFDRLADESGARVFVRADFAALEDALERIKINSRRLAKQQRTWLKRLTRVSWIDVGTGDDIASIVSRATPLVDPK